LGRLKRTWATGGVWAGSSGVAREKSPSLLLFALVVHGDLETIDDAEGERRATQELCVAPTLVVEQVEGLSHEVATEKRRR
jgi:hypothetical protein